MKMLPANRLIEAIESWDLLDKFAGGFDFLADENFQRDPKEMVAAMVSIVPADAGLFRNVVPKAEEDFVKTNQREAWEKRM